MTSPLTLLRPFFKCSSGKIWPLSPKLVEFMVVKHEKVIVNGEEWEKRSHYKPKDMRWSNVKAPDKKTPSWVISVEKNNNFQLYSYNPHSVTPLLFYLIRSIDGAQGGHSSAVLFLLAIATLALLLQSWTWGKASPATILKGFWGNLVWPGAVWITGDACFSSVWEWESRFSMRAGTRSLMILLHFIGSFWARKGNDIGRCIELDAVHRDTECFCEY